MLHMFTGLLLHAVRRESLFAISVAVSLGHTFASHRLLLFLLRPPPLMFLASIGLQSSFFSCSFFMLVFFSFLFVR